MQARVTLHARDGSPRARLVRLGERLILGRGRGGVDLHLEDRLVSRRHAALELSDEGLLLTDLGSRNGTYVGGQRLEPGEPTRLPVGIVARLGEHTLTQETDEATAIAMADSLPLPPEEFEVLGEIGAGAFGRVWAARQRLLGRMVAIKGLRPELELDAEERQGILREARLYCAIHSPYVVQLYDLRVVEGRPFLILEYVDGASAADRLKRGPLPIPEALSIGLDVARGLEAIARAGMIHRDVKPQNVLLCLDGRAKLADLGIARLLEASSASGDMGLGTLPYVAPEQADRKRGPLDPRTDLYGLGATIYHLITRRPPFGFHAERVDPLDVIYAVLEESPPAPRDLRADCPEPVERLLLRLLEKDPSDRPPSAASVVRELEALRAELYPTYAPASAASEEELDALPPR